MGKGFYISKAVVVTCVVVAISAVATIIALSVVYSQEKSKNEATAPSTISPNTATPSTQPPATTPSTPKEPWQCYRLPDSLAPISYNVTLWPRLEPNADDLYIFSGNSKVVFKCVKETDLILIHSNKLNLTTFKEHHATLTGLDGATAPTVKKTWLEAPTQYLVVQLNSPLQAGSIYELFTDFVGELADDLGGFYRSEYIEDGVKKVVATTQMQPTDARKAFPCFDEPAMKAVFHMTLIHPQETVALSNSMNYDPVNITMHGLNLTQTRFEPTEIMSTYLLAFVVCEFTYIASKPEADVLVRIWARRKAIEEGQGDYALEKTGPILAFFEKYYNSSYPLKKSDQIALPDFSAGAMENWGLITYRETALLYNPGVSSNGDKEWVATVISHELAHMWFGNLVTTRWWNDLWLNEGFATYVSYLGANKAEPTWNMKDLIVLNEIFGVMAVDALASSHPLSSKEEDILKPEHISELFDSITYSKGAAVLRMLSEFITESVFSKGLHTYLEEFKYNNTVYTDLWKHLQMAVDKAGISLPSPVEVIMNRWILQMGFPVVTIDTKTGSITQKHFLLDPDSVVDRPSPFNYEWYVPITWIKTGVEKEQYWLVAKEATNKNMTLGVDEWLVANIDMRGFYRVNYDSDNWERLLTQLGSKHTDIPVINRAQIIDDAFNLARAKMVNTTLALRTTKFLHEEVEYMPWQTARRNLDYFYLMFDRSEVYGPMQAYIKKQVTPLFDYFKDLTVNWTKIPEKHTDQYNQVNAISLACSTGVEGCKNLTTGWFKEWMENEANNTISPNLKSTVYCSAIAAGGEEEWDFAWSMYKNATIASEADKLMYALSCTKQPWLLNRYLKYCLDPKKIRKQDATFTIVYIASNPIGQPLAWDFIRSNWNHIFNDYGGGSFSFGRLIDGVTKRFSTEFEYKQLLHLICHLHAKGVSELELQVECLHTAAECCDGVKTEITCVEQLQQPTTASDCLDTTTEGSWVENCPVESSVVDCEHSKPGNAEKDWSLSVSTPTSEVRPQEHGLGSPEERVCLSSNTERDYCQTEEEGREQPVVSTQSLSLCDRSEEAQSEPEGASLTVGTLPPAGCGKQAEETDRGEAVIREGQEATKGVDRCEQEEEDSTAWRREEEASSESTDLITTSGDTKALVMGQSPSSGGSEVSDNSDCEVKDCSQEGETVEGEEVKLIEDLSDGLFYEEEKVENEELTDPVSTPGDLPNPSLIDCGGVIEDPEPAFSRLLIEGLHKGEPPPDINSLEQNQETAGRDYATEQQQGRAPETCCHSGNCTGTASCKELDGEDVAEPSACSIENITLTMDEHDHTEDCQSAGNSTEETRTDQVDCEQSPEVVPSSGDGQADLDSCMAHGLSSDDDGSFRSVGSSTTEIFHSTQDSATMEEPDLDITQTKIAELSSAGSMMEESNDVSPGEGDEHSLTVDAGLPSELGAVSAETVTDCNQTGTEPESQLPPSPQTMEALNPEGAGEELVPELSKEDLLLGPVLSESEGSPTVNVDASETGESNSSDLNAETEHPASEVTSGGSFERGHSVAEETEVTSPVGGDHQCPETSDRSVVASGEESGPVQSVLQQEKQDNLEMTADERSPDEGLRHSENQIDASPSQSIPLLSDSAEVELSCPNNEASNEPPVENEMTESPKTLDTVDGASESHNSEIQEVDVIKSEDTVIAAGEEENDTAEETDFSTIHRDREASFHQPCDTQHSGSSQSSAFPSLPSRTSSTTSCPSAAHRDSGSDIESFLNAEPGYDSVFRKNDEPVTGGDSTSEVSVSCSSTDDTASVGPSSSSPEGSQGLGCSWSPEEGVQTGAATSAGLDGGGGGGAAGDAEEEAKDRVTEVPRRSCLLRNSLRSLSPLRRHSWGPGKNNGGDTEMNQRSSIRSPGEGKPTFHRRSYSLEGLSGGPEELRGPTTQGPRILEPLRMPRQDSDDRGSLVSLTEEQEELGDHGRLHDPKSRRYRPLRNSCPPMSLPLTKSVSMLAISQRDIDGMRSFSSTSGSLAYSISEEEPGPLRSDTEGKGATKVSRTFSYLKNKMYKKTRVSEHDVF
uniref:Alanyl aminopeptidase, membrane n=1 Tax=Seriola lalandi dorsalis TaxID=1841481 RepID=A0A3B4XXH8_SERLL